MSGGINAYRILSTLIIDTTVFKIIWNAKNFQVNLHLFYRQGKID